ncbi:MAG: translation initiation factor IF-3 [Rhodospirillaceae bacterium]|nr:translation initiation factor IF-3 [Rhodospirillales bacterium]MBT3906408.1 translation initiation factor IF-3 [Rhodospirillaceae bacterium]MBT5032961.1 translation initiation factor IF-3 [Rhodospirillaceae bacterium]MBT6219770.1 translation initiation factor IF-3 [Rhodospirillaceae bacterium]MBT6360620.1 translation initiation factor IF-3 [Rhodospirillaceae bacterium]
MAKRPQNQAPGHSGPRVNDMIDAPEIRVVGADGEMVGVLTVAEGIELADEFGLDLVEIAPNSDPPVCKVLDYGKYKYEEQKRRNEARKKQKTIEVKEIKMRPGIDTHDYETKMKAARKFLNNGDKVKVTIRFRGREMAHQELGMKVLDRVREGLEEMAKLEQFPKMEGRMMTMVVAPK